MIISTLPDHIVLLIIVVFPEMLLNFFYFVNEWVGEVWSCSAAERKSLQRETIGDEVPTLQVRLNRR